MEIIPRASSYLLFLASQFWYIWLILMLNDKTEIYMPLSWTKDKMGKVKVLVTQLCPTICDPMDCSSPGSSVHGILQEKMLEWVTIAFSKGFSQHRDKTQVSCIADRFFTIWATREAHKMGKDIINPCSGPTGGPIMLWFQCLIIIILFK